MSARSELANFQELSQRLLSAQSVPRQNFIFSVSNFEKITFLSYKFWKLQFDSLTFWYLLYFGDSSFENYILIIGISQNFNLVPLRFSYFLYARSEFLNFQVLNQCLVSAKSVQRQQFIFQPIIFGSIIVLSHKILEIIIFSHMFW